MDFLISLAAVLVVLGIMILVHEWGHFVAARACGVRVDVFSIGFGPRIWGWQRGPTDYRVSALPLGGYVRMAGDNPAEERTGAPDEFLSKPRWQRAVIVLAGPTMNLISAVVLIAFLFATGGVPDSAHHDDPLQIAGVLPDSPAAQAGIQPGDRIVELNGVENPVWWKAEMELQLAALGGNIEAVVEREGRRIPVEIPAAAGGGRAREFFFLGYPSQEVTVGDVREGSPAARAGLQSGDILRAADGQRVHHPVQFSHVVEGSEGRPLKLTIERGGETRELEVAAEYADPGDGVTRWVVGIGYQQPGATLAVPDAVVRSAWFNVRMSRQILLVIVQLVRGGVSIKQLEGPVGIMRHAGQAAKLGVGPLLFLTAIISLNLGILNLLPIPILDGGHLLMLSIEGVMRRDLSVRVKERFVQVGLVFLLVIFAIVMYNDVLKLFTRG